MVRIAVFQYEKPLQSHTVNLVNSLVVAGYHVDLFIKDCSADLVTELTAGTLLSVHDWSQPFKTGWPLIETFCAKAINAAGLVLRGGQYRPLVPFIELLTILRLRNSRYLCTIGIEKGGMIWASLASRITSSPFIYYSLELYDDSHPFYRGTKFFAQLRKSEKNAHREALATIIQDEQRWEHLKNVNEVDTDVIYLPVSVPGDPIVKKTDYFYRKFGLEESTTLLLYLGVIEEERNCLDIALASVASTYPFIVVFHGYGTDEFLDKLKKFGGEKVLLSTGLVPDSQIPEIIASATIGVCLYRDTCANDRLTAFSSEKLVLYLKAGLPIIAPDNESYRGLMNQFPCGILIREVSEIPQAVELIMANYHFYRNNAYSAFTKLFKYENNLIALISYLRKLEHGN